LAEFLFDPRSRPEPLVLLATQHLSSGQAYTPEPNRSERAARQRAADSPRLPAVATSCRNAQSSRRVSGTTRNAGHLMR
jgi:hypothetical protein